jgi:subtilisin family serine protease
VAAATGNNGKGIAGVDWQTKILPIQALDDSGYGNTWGVGQAIYYAASMGADVISLSLGSDLPDDYVREAVQAATAAGSVVVAASGNDGCNCIVYPANYPEVVAVGALNSSSQPASFSSYGANLDILAPGTQITTSSWTAANPTNAYASNVQGTSFATPLVSGLLSRMLSTRPDATPLQLIAALTENTNRLSLGSNVSRTTTLGYGSTDGYKAASRLVTPHDTAHLYRFSPVSTGAHLAPSAPAEVSGTDAVQKCEDGHPGSTPVFEIYKPGSHFFTISQTEVWLAQRAGYQSSLFAEACLQQPHDTTDSMRNLNLFKEFRNIYEHSVE